MGCSNNKVAKTVPADKTAVLEKRHDNNEDIRDKYALGAILGSGSFGQVREASLKSGGSEVRAVKMIERDNDDGEWSNQAIFVREVGLLQTIQHDNIISYYDFYEDLHFLYVVMELCKGGEVFAKIVEIKRFSEKNAASLGQQMLLAMLYIHQKSIAHRDIKAENFMLAEPSINAKVKMIDFGMACKFEDKQVLTELCGSPHYLAPELIGQKYDYRADVWAFGVLLYLLQYGHYPYDAKHPRDIMVKILTEPIRWQTKVKLSKDGLDFLKKLLEHEPKKRMSAEEALAHTWMKLATSKEEGEILNTEVLRSAHKKVTATRKTVDAKVDELRNNKLKAIEEDFSKGLRHGKRIGETPKEELALLQSKPEFVRRENKITTAPSKQIDARRGSIGKMLQTLGGKAAGKPKPPGGLGAIEESGGGGGAGLALVPGFGPSPAGGGGGGPARSMSCAAGAGLMGGKPSKRLSYIGTLSGNEEKNLASLYEEKKGKALAVVPEPNADKKDEDLTE